MKKTGYLIIFLVLSKTIFAQQSDAIGTLGIQIEKKVNRTFSGVFYTQYGFNENFTELGYFLNDFGLNIKLNESFTIGLNYRITEIKLDNNQYQSRYLTYGDISYNKSAGAFFVLARSRFLTKAYGYHFDDELNYKTDAHYLRNKLQVKYEINYNYSVFASGEQIYRLDRENNTDQIRIAAGINYQINKQQRLQFTHTYSRELNTKRPDTNFIYGLTYYFKF